MEDDFGSSKQKPGIMSSISRFFSGKRAVTEEDIQDIIDAGEEIGLINQEENEMIRSIFSLGDTIVREIMVPRTEMAFIDSKATVREVIDAIIDCGHSRIPVYEGTIDNIVGLLYAKDLLIYWGTDESEISISTIMRQPYFVPETKNLEELLQEFKKKRVHLAVVIDEYGGTSGIVTIEDLLEQIVGDIQDEYDREEVLIQKLEDGSCVIDGKLPVEELENYLDVTFEREKFDTVAGLIFHFTGKIPVAGDIFEYEGVSFTIEEADQRKVKKVIASRIQSSKESAQK